ncbi:nucleotidyltransferase family protein [Caldalkalibacillus mannanilyticus]|uniref:nucleotidyltransferase family protein n=1 Tax=Caldalkalibacillus mannanilyticus TaxID=1418 RepID=UPI000469B4ED|nr:nucleotidyltransferase family protein [Caldalkalibacillus mannanilyticus]
MHNWKKAIVKMSDTIHDTIQKIDDSSLQIALVIDEQERLVGTVTDGDVRRGILKGIPLHHSVVDIMNPEPFKLEEGLDNLKVLVNMKRMHLRHIPIVNKENQIVDLKYYEDLLEFQTKDNWVVLMAGGLGSRLRPLTEDTPKPLLKIGDKPILETILESFIEHGFYNFYISVNYKAEMIEDYFKDGSQWGVNIRYLRENQRLGTAGPLSLLPETPNKPILVMNGDLLTKVNFAQMLQFHTENQSKATMCVREYNVQIPYGVVHVDQHRLRGIEEKPIQSYFVSAGIYLLDPSVIQRIPVGEFFDMPTLYEELIKEGEETSVFPIREYWLDIGRVDDFHKANGDYSEIFG